MSTLSKSSSNAAIVPECSVKSQTAIAQYKVNIRCGTFQPSTVHLDATAADNLTIDVTGAEQLDKVMEAIRQLKGVQRVTRMS